MPLREVWPLAWEFNKHFCSELLFVVCWPDMTTKPTGLSLYEPMMSRADSFIYIWLFAFMNNNCMVDPGSLSDMLKKLPGPVKLPVLYIIDDWAKFYYKRLPLLVSNFANILLITFSSFITCKMNSIVFYYFQDNSYI